MNSFKNIILLIFFSIATPNLFAKIRILTFHYNKPEFIHFQHLLFEKFLVEKNDYELIVFNDAVDQKVKDEIESICLKLKIKHIFFPQHLHTLGSFLEKTKKFERDYNVDIIKGWNLFEIIPGSIRHCEVAQYALDNFGYDHNDIVGLIDGDMFLVRPFSIRKTIDKYNIIGARATDYNFKNKEYNWIALSFFKIYNLPNKNTFNFDCCFYSDGVNTSKEISFSDFTDIFLDSGGSTYKYLKDNPNVRYKLYEKSPISSLSILNYNELEELKYNSNEINFILNMKDYKQENTFVSTEFHLDNNFIHYSWSRNSLLDTVKINSFNLFFESLLRD